MCKSKILFVLQCTVLTSFLTGAASAQTYSWSGINGADWSTATNWTPNGVPGAGDTANISTVNNGPALSSSVTVTAFNVSNGGAPTITSPFTLTCATATLNAINSIYGMGDWIINTSLTSDNANGVSNTVSPNVTNNGVITVNTGNLALNSVTNNGNVIATNVGTKAIFFSGFVYVSGSLTGTLDVEGVFTLNNNLTILSGSMLTGGFTFGGTFNGPGTLTCASGATITFSSSGMTFNCPVNIQAGGALNITGSNYQFNANVTTNGPLTASGTQLALGPSSTVTINGQASLSNGAYFSDSGSVIVASAATVQCQTSGSTNGFESSGFTNNGAITVNSGQLLIMSGTGGTNNGTINASAGGASVLVEDGFTNVSGGILEGNFVISGTLTINSALNYVGTLTIGIPTNGGTINGTGPLTIPSGSTLSAPSATNGGANINVPTTIAAGAQMNVAVATGIGANITANGPVTFSNAGNCSSSATLTCNAALNITSTNIGGSGTIAIGSAGTLTSINGAGTNSLAGNSVLNAGTVITQTGTLNLGSNYIQSAGSTQLNGGNLSGTIQLNGGTLTGVGSVSGNVTNGATITLAGASAAGTLAITGNYTQAAGGALSIAIGGTTAGTQFDQVTVTGTASLKGTLNVALFNSFAPGGNTFSILTAATVTGAFATTSNGTTGLSPAYTATLVNLNTANNPVPSVTSINPLVAAPAGASFTMTITGSNFVAGAQVLWSGQTNLTPSTLSAGIITVTVPAAYIATSGTATVSVSNPVPGGGASNNVTFTINSSNSVPTLTSLAPTSATAGAAAFNLTVTGTNFVSTSTINFNGAPKVTTFVSQTQLTAAITAADISTVGSVNVTVTSPAPGGGTTAPQTFTISPNTSGGGGGGGGGTVGPPQPPFIASGPFATPNPGVAGQPVTLIAIAGDLDGDQVTYSWDFGDSSPAGAGSVVAHTYATAGVYTVTVTVSDGTSTISDMVNVAVNAAASTDALNIQKAALKFAFSGGSKDSLQFSGTLSGPTSAKSVTLQIGSLKKTFSSGDKSNKLTLKSGKFVLSVKGTPLFSALQSFGFTNATVGKPGAPLTLDVILTLDGVSFTNSVTVLYTAKAGSGGQAKK